MLEWKSVQAGRIGKGICCCWYGIFPHSFRLWLTNISIFNVYLLFNSDTHMARCYKKKINTRWKWIKDIFNKNAHQSDSLPSEWRKLTERQRMMASTKSKNGGFHLLHNIPMYKTVKHVMHEHWVKVSIQKNMKKLVHAHCTFLHPYIHYMIHISGLNCVLLCILSVLQWRFSIWLLTNSNILKFYWNQIEY